MKSWLNYLPIMKNIPSVEAYRKSLRKIDFMKNAKCRCHRCWKAKCKGDKTISYFKIHPGDFEELFYPSRHDFDSDSESDYSYDITNPNN